MLQNYISFDAINRIGILLNFFAGFMLAPQLLGLHRLKRIESFIEKVTAKLSFTITHIIRRLKLQVVPCNELLRIILMYLIGAILLIVLPYWLFKIKEYVILSFVLLIGLIFLFGIIEGAYVPYIHHNFKKFVFKRVFALSIGVGYVAIFYPLLMLALLLFRGFNKPTRFLLRKLEGDERLQSILIWWGIVFFIVGNFFQFIATFNNNANR